MRLALLVLIALATLARAATPRQSGPILARALDREDAWFASPEGRHFMDNIVAWQNHNGGWWKEYDPDTPRPADRSDTRTSTIDNGATATEMRLLARARRINAGPAGQAYRDSFARGLQFLLESQYPNGGFPQRFPLEANYGRHITFNDNAMVNAMRILQSVSAARAPDYAFVSDADRQRAREAFDRGVDCILKCQLRNRDGKLTAWCQQHDEVTLAPANARSYELPSIAAAESSDIVLLLMSLEKPSPQVIDSIEAAVAWLDATKIVGKRYAPQVDEQGKTTDWTITDDPNAPPLWARYYDLDANRPFFANRDGVKTPSYDAVAKERRIGYRWYGTWGNRVLEEHPKWKARVAPRATTGRIDGGR